MGVGAAGDLDRGVGADGAGAAGVVGIGPVVAGLLLGNGDRRGLDDGMDLGLSLDVVNGVVTHLERIGVGLVRGVLEAALGTGQAVEFVVGEGLLDRAAVLVGWGDRDLVVEGEDIADLVVAVLEVLEERALAGGEGGEAPGLGVVGVGG